MKLLNHIMGSCSLVSLALVLASACTFRERDEQPRAKIKNPGQWYTPGRDSVARNEEGACWGARERRVTTPTDFGPSGPRQGVFDLRTQGGSGPPPPSTGPVEIKQVQDLPGDPGPVVQADAHPSLQAAVDALPATGGTVSLAAKTYVIRQTLLIPSGVALVGQGTGSVFSLADGVKGPAIANRGVDGAGDRGIRLARFVIDGHREAQTADQALIYFDHIQDAVLEELTVRNGVATGVNLRHFTHGLIRHCDFSGNGLSAAFVASGLNLNDGCDDNTVEHNVMNDNNAGHGLTGYPFDGNGIRIGDGCRRNVVRFNVCNHNGRRGIKVQGAANHVSDNSLAGNMGHSLLVGGLECRDNVIENNRIVAGEHAAIHLTADATGGVGTEGNALLRNQISGGHYGIEVGWGARQNRIVANRLRGTTSHGLFLRGSSDNLVEANEVRDCGQGQLANAIQIEGQANRPSARNVIRGNVCTDTRPTKKQAYGLWVATDAPQTTAEGNDFRGNLRTPGMQVEGRDSVLGANRI